MNIQFLNTILVNDKTYIDVCNIDGQLKTFLMKKIKEPNIFDAVKIEEGNTAGTINEKLDSN